MTKEELVWIAAVFDCEGCIGLVKPKHRLKSGEIKIYKYPIVVLGHTCLDVITRFHNLVGMGHFYVYDYSDKPWFKGKKQPYRWTTGKNTDVKAFIALIWNEWISSYRRTKAIKLGIAPSKTNLNSFVTPSTEINHTLRRVFLELDEDEDIEEYNRILMEYE